jgi:glycosyltransferase involved in cell wall biosynthesis
MVVVLEATLGGIRKHVVDLISGLDPARYDITFVYSLVRADPTFNSNLDDLRKKGIELVEISMHREIRPFLDLVAFLRLVHVLRTHRTQILYMHGAKAGALGRLAAFLFPGVRCVYNPHGGSFHKFTGVSGLLYRAAEGILTLRTHAFIGVSTDSCNNIKRTLGVDASRVHLVYNGIDVGATDQARQKNPVNRPDLRFADGRFVILYPALFLEAKGHLQFIDAMARHPLRREILFLLAGEGPLRDQIVDSIAARQLQDRFLVLSYLLDLAPYYELCDMVILPSLAEVFGYVLLEAMAYSKPIVASRVGGIPELVSDGHNGRLFDAREMGNVAEMLNYYVDHRGELGVFGTNGRRLVEQKFSLSQMVIGTEAVLQSVLQSQE